MKKGIMIISVLLLLTGCAQARHAYTFGIIQIAEHPSLDRVVEGFEDVLAENMEGIDYKIIHRNAQNDLGNLQMMTQQFNTLQVDGILAVGTLAAQSAKLATQKSGIPVIFNTVTDPVEAGLLDDIHNPKGNITGVSDQAPMDKQIEMIRELQPDAQKIGVLYNIGEVNSRVQLNMLEPILNQNGLMLDAQGVGNIQDLELASSQLVKRVDALFTLTDNLVVSGLSNVIGKADSANVPVYASEAGQIDLGITAAESLDYYELGKISGHQMVQVSVHKQTIDSIPVVYSKETTRTMNEAMMKKYSLKN